MSFAKGKVVNNESPMDGDSLIQCGKSLKASSIPCGTYNPNSRQVKVVVPIIPPKYSANGFFPSVSKIAERAANISKTINHK